MENFYIFIHNGGYTTVSGDYNSNTDIVNNLGNTWEEYIEGKYVMLNSEQVSYLDSNPSSTPHEAFFMEESDEVTSYNKDALIADIESYDLSPEVNTFYINNEPAWFDLNKRATLNYSLNKEKEAGNENTVLWINNNQYNVSIDTAIQMLSDIEMYAITCNNVTRGHIADVLNITSKSQLKSFNITEGYPEKLNFSI